MNSKFTECNGIAMQKLNKLICVYNVDDTLNQGGLITHETTIMMSHKGHCEKAVFEVCNLGKSNIIISYTWLKKHNLEIDWKTGSIQFTRCPQECNVAIRELGLDTVTVTDGYIAPIVHHPYHIHQA